METTVMSSSATDLLNIESMLSDEERMIRDAVREWVDERAQPIFGKHFEDGTFPLHLTPELAELGVFGAHLHGYGCAGVSNVVYGLICQELERCDSGLRSFVSVQGSLCMFPIYTYGSEAQKQKYLPKMAKGELIGCFGLTEPDAGSNPGGMRTTATLDGDEYVLNGAKMWITNGTIADVAIVWAKTPHDGQIRGFLVEKGTPGFTAPEIEHKFSLRASITSELIFDDCRIPKDNLLPLTGGIKSPLSCLTEARFGITFGVIGAAMSCYESTLNYTLNRPVAGGPIARFQLVQSALVDMVNEITKGQLMALQLGRMKDAGKDAGNGRGFKPAMVSLVKMNNCKVALDIARSARDLHGANGISNEYPIIRHMLNLESVITYEGTHNIHKMIVGREITGENALF